MIVRMSWLRRVAMKYSQRRVMDEIFEVDATAILCKVPKTAVAHWIDRDTKGRGELAHANK